MPAARPAGRAAGMGFPVSMVSGRQSDLRGQNAGQLPAQAAGMGHGPVGVLDALVSFEISTRFFFRFSCGWAFEVARFCVAQSTGRDS